MEVVDGAGQIILNSIIMVRDRATMVIEVMVKEMGRPKMADFYPHIMAVAYRLLGVYPWLLQDIRSLQNVNIRCLP